MGKPRESSTPRPVSNWRAVYGTDFEAGSAAYVRGASVHRSPRGERGHYWRWGWRYARIRARDDALDVRLTFVARRHLAALRREASDLMVWLHPHSGACDVNPCCTNYTGNGMVCFGTVAEVLERLATPTARPPRGRTT